MRILFSVISLAVYVSAQEAVWYNCPLLTLKKGETQTSTNPTVQCADIDVPLCHPQVCSSTKTIKVFVKRIPAQKSSGSKPQALWMLQGGPGESSINMEGLMAEAYIDANRTVSVYTMDHRGTGRSAGISCAENNYPYSPTMTVNCISKVKTTYGSVAPAAFSVTSAASDLSYLIENSLSTSDVFVYGLSYGTYLVERLMHLAPSNVKGYILDSIQSEQFYKTRDAPYYSNWDRDVAGTVETFFKYCDNDTYCSSRVGPKSKAYLQGLYAILDKGQSKCGDIIRQMVPEFKTNPSWLVNNFLYSFLRDYNKRNLIPVYMYRLNRCNTADQAMVVNTINFLKKNTDSNLFMTNLDTPDDSNRVATLSSEGRSTLVYKSIVLSEIWELPTPSRDIMSKWFEEALMGAMSPLTLNQTLIDNCIYLSGNDPICDSFSLPFSSSGFIYARDHYWNKTAPIPLGASVLMFTGLLDPATPTKYAKDEAETMSGTNKKLYEFAYSPHVILGQTPTESGDCGFQILSSYIINRGDLSKVKDDCVAKVLKMNFTTVLDSESAIEIFGTDIDVYGPGAAGPNPSASLPSNTGSNTVAPSNGPASSAYIPSISAMLVLLMISVYL